AKPLSSAQPINAYQHLMTRVDAKQIDALLAANRGSLQADGAAAAAASGATGAAAAKDAKPAKANAKAAAANAANDGPISI
ncbi:methionine--tRNA ligase, partial [Burkholderia sp. SIMBA_057]